MPTYEYRCQNCKKKFEVSQKISDAPLSYCEACGQSTLQRGPGGGVGIAFKGSGFYSTDYKPNQSSSSSDSPSTTPSQGCCPCGKNQGSCSS